MMKQQLSAFLLSGAVMGVSLGILALGYMLSADNSPALMVRKLDIAVSQPPPPPPPQSQQVTEQADVNMQVEGAGAAVSMADMRIDPTIDIDKPDMPNVVMNQPQWEAPEIDWDAYGLGELDDKPTLLTPLKIHFPKKLKRRGIDRVVVKLDVLIDEKGDVTLINILDNPHHELNKEIHRFVRSSKFTAPHKAHEAVRARFIWPVEIEA
ncbi:energy transducer TonB [Alteromonas sp. 14N.309.X.WAT.G.H12]|uniref:energy transducer TonB n=1 Tax=Alteromonas sp. 14N.309.X.WAT.G.H12 TaxID=3120824 RepID=UPI002FD1F1CA